MKVGCSWLTNCFGNKFKQLVSRGYFGGYGPQRENNKTNWVRKRLPRVLWVSAPSKDAVAANLVALQLHMMLQTYSFYTAGIQKWNKNKKINKRNVGKNGLE